MRMTYCMCVAVFLIVTAQNIEAADTKKFNGESYLALDKSNRLTFVQGILFGAKTQSDIVSNTLQGSKESFKIILKSLTKKEEIDDIAAYVDGIDTCMETNANVGIALLEEKELCTFIDALYAKPENGQILFRDALILFYMDKFSTTPAATKQLEGYLRAGKTPEAWEKVKIIEEPGKKPYPLNPYAFR